MFFLLRVAFWLTIVFALLPSGRSQSDAQAKVGATDAVVAAGVAVSDMSGFCSRQPQACVVGAQAAVTIAQRAQAGAKMVYEFITERVTQSETQAEAETGAVANRKIVAAREAPPIPGSQGTLKPADVEPTWQRPPARIQAVPLPRKDPRYKA